MLRKLVISRKTIEKLNQFPSFQKHQISDSECIAQKININQKRMRVKSTNDINWKASKECVSAATMAYEQKIYFFFEISKTEIAHKHTHLK